jgi:hypothetical protein
MGVPDTNLDSDKWEALKAKYGDEFGKPASKRSSDPYNKRARWKPMKYVKDKFGITDSFTSNRHERRARKHDR